MLPKEILTCFDTLEVKPEASFKEVQRAWREMAKVWHPDRFPDDSNLQSKGQEKLKRINQAYEKLQDFFENPERFKDTPSVSTEPQSDSTTNDTSVSPANPPTAETMAHDKGGGLAFIVGIVAFIIFCCFCRDAVGGGLFSEAESYINWPGVFIGTGVCAFIAYHIGKKL